MKTLEAHDVRMTFRIPGKPPLEVLKGVDISVEEGERVAILGRSGAGKSTLLHILGGLQKPTAGKVVRVSRPGFVFQSYHLMPELTVFENVYLPAMARSGGKSELKARARELVSAVGLDSRADHLPSELSGGERQRVALARALVLSPAIVLADEPTGNLDEMTGADILRMLTGLSSGSTSLVMVTHSSAAAAVCHRTLFLEDGVLKTVRDGR